MIIKNGCASLRAIEKEDFDLLFYLINAPEIEEMIGGWCLPINSMAQEKWIDNFANTEKNIKLMIELENGKTIGMITMKDYIEKLINKNLVDGRDAYIKMSKLDDLEEKI